MQNFEVSKIKGCTRVVGGMSHDVLTCIENLELVSFHFPVHQLKIYRVTTAQGNQGILMFIFRWFKFTLKPPNSITHGNLLLAIWDTSHWNFFVKFRLKIA